MPLQVGIEYFFRCKSFRTFGTLEGLFCMKFKMSIKTLKASETLWAIGALKRAFFRFHMDHSSVPPEVIIIGECPWALDALGGQIHHMRVHVSHETAAVRKNPCTNLTASMFIFAGLSQMLRFHVLAKIRVVPKSFGASGTLMRSRVRFGMSYKFFILGKGRCICRLLFPCAFSGEPSDIATSYRSSSSGST